MDFDRDAEYAMVQKLFDHVSPLNRLEERVNDMEACQSKNIAELRQTLDILNERLGSISELLLRVEQRVSAVESHYEAWLAFMEADEGYERRR
jgi:hypothetical protein